MLSSSARVLVLGFSVRVSVQGSRTMDVEGPEFLCKRPSASWSSTLKTCRRPLEAPGQLPAATRLVTQME